MVTYVRKKHEVIKRTGAILLSTLGRHCQVAAPSTIRACRRLHLKGDNVRQISMLKGWSAPWLKRCDRCQLCWCWSLGNEHLRGQHCTWATGSGCISSCCIPQVRWTHLSSSRRWWSSMTRHVFANFSRLFEIVWRPRSVTRNSVHRVGLNWFSLICPVCLPDALLFFFKCRLLFKYFTFSCTLAT